MWSADEQPPGWSVIPVGSHERYSSTRRPPPPPPELSQAHRPATVIPQRERITFLVRLCEVFARIGGTFAALAVVEGYVVLNVVPMSASGRGVMVGCRYSRDGAWWLYDVHTGEAIRPANDLRAAAHKIRAQMEEAATV